MTCSGKNVLKDDTKCAAYNLANLAQLGERQTEDLKVPGSIPGVGTSFCFHHSIKGLYYNIIQYE